MKKVLYLNNLGQLGGAEFALGRLLESLDTRSVNPVVMFASDGPAVNMIRELGVETHTRHLSPEVSNVKKDSLVLSGLGQIPRYGLLSTRVARYALDIARFAHKNRIDIIHTNSMKAHIFGGIAGRLAGIPVVWHVRDYIDQSYLPQSAVLLIRKMARTVPKRVIAVSDSVLSKTQVFKPRGQTIYDGLVDQRELDKDFNQGVSLSTRPWSRKEKIRVGIVGGLRDWKGQHVFLEAAASVLRCGYRNISFEIIGGSLFGEEMYETKLKELSCTFGINNYVTFHGFRHDIPEVLRGIDILVHASTSPDPCPNVVLEGLAAGLPVIGSHGGGVPEIITHEENGLLAPMGDSEQLAEEIIKLLENPILALKIATNGHKHVRERFRSSTTARAVENLYFDVC